MKRVLLFALLAMLLFCSCERLFESPKDKLDRLVSAHWDAWKAEGKDTTMCIVDIAKIVPIEWDTVVYVMYDRFFDYKNDDVVNYINNRYWVENEQYRGYPEEGIHFWKDGKIVYEISLWYDGDDGNCACVYAKNDFIVCDRSNAKLRLERDGRYYILRDLPQRYLDSIRYVPDYKTRE